ncbi:MAG: murein biosynthesis integral membrane protein MurJ [Clostridia bacterium]|jgi:putative peptidoglycan lipid II flippase|nr:murein biosynthesis integral membrane protein MurJ [Clostridia bacterium]
MKNEKDYAVKAAGLMMIITLIGKLLGLIRDQLLACNYSVGREASAFLTASRIPRIFFDVVFASAISASFIPVFNEYMKKKGKKEAFKLSNNFITLINLLTITLTILGIIFAPVLTNIFADGFDSETAALCTSLLRILFPATIFTGLAFSFVGILQSMDEFNVPAAMSIASNLVIIIYYLFFNKKFGIYGLTIAFLIGWAMQAIIQIPSLIKRKYVYKPYLNLKDEGIKKILILMLPVMVGTWVQPINLAINTKFASHLFEGSGVSAVEYANTVYSIIVGVFVLSIANVIFPRLSRMSIENDKDNFSKTISETFEAMFYVIIPMTVGLMCVSQAVVRLIYQHGGFNEFAVGITSKALFFFSAGMIGFGIQNILSRAFYAQQNGKMPLISGVISIGLNLILCMLLTSRFDVAGLAIASTVSQTAAAFVLLVPMQIKNKLIDKRLIKELFKMAVAAFIMAIAVIAVKKFVVSFAGASTIGNLIYFAVPAIVGIIVYIIMSFVLKISEFKMAIAMIFKILKRGAKD